MAFNLNRKKKLITSSLVMTITMGLSSQVALAQETYTVQRNDTLYSIANRYGVSVPELMAWNNIDNGIIYVGSNLVVSNDEPDTRVPAVTEETSMETVVDQTTSSNLTNQVSSSNEVSPSQAQSTNNNASATTYTVKAGDYLYKIASEYGVTVQNLKEWNNLSSNYIYVGDVLRVKPMTHSSPSTEPESKPEINRPIRQTQDLSNAKTYTVKRGDYLHKIAGQFGVTVQNLIDWNKLTTNYIYVGDILKVSPPQTSVSQTLVEANKPNDKPQVESKAETYTVKRGDYLYKIASQYGITVQNLIDWNKLTTNYIYVGDVLKVSQPQTSVSETQSEANKPKDKPQAESKAKTYTVKRGDYLYKIASQYGITVQNLIDWNKLTTNYIYVGDVLKVSPPQTSVSQTQSETNKPNEKPETRPRPSGPLKTYTVKSGDYLYKIANQFGVTVAQLREWNNMPNNYVYVGDVLAVSKPQQTAPKPEELDVRIPDLSVAQPRSVNYDIKLNSTTDPLRTTRSLTGITRNAVDYFGQRFNVLREFNVNGKTYMELTNSAGTIVGYVPKSAGVEVPQGVNTVYIDAGHGGTEPGATNFGVQEKTLNLNITRQFAQRLRNLGYHVYESRTTDKTIPLYERTFEPNRLMPDVYVSIHHNAMPLPGSAQGIVTLYHDPSIDEPDYMTVPHHYGTDIIPEGKRLSATIQNALIRATGAVNQGIRPQNLHVTRKTDVPATLVELGFMDHWGEHQKLITPSYQQKLINGLVNGINAYFGKTR